MDRGDEKGATKKVALVCYKIERGKGSEDGSGYGFASALAKQSRIRITLFTRRNNIEKLYKDSVFDQVELVPVEVPKYLTWWKRGSRGIIPYYYLWQISAAREVERLHQVQKFDVVHQYNFHADWAPHFYKAVGAKIVWGPICHQPILPLHYSRGGGIAGIIREVAKHTLKSAFWYLDLNLRRAVARTDVVLYANQDIAPPFRRYLATGRVQLQTFGGASFDCPPIDTSMSTVFTLLHVGRMVPIKGAKLALLAFSDFYRSAGTPPARLILLGDGPLRENLLATAQRLGINEAVEFIPWMKHESVVEVYMQAHAFLYPSLANQDTVVAEALAVGLPILGVSGGGTQVMAGNAGLYAPRGPSRETRKSFAISISQLFNEWSSDPQKFASRTADAVRRSKKISWTATAQSVRAYYD